MSRRSDQLRTVAQDFCSVHESWVNDENRIVPDEIYWDAVDTLTESFGAGDIPEDCRPLFEAVQQLAEEATAFDDRDDFKDVVPPDSFWDARQRVEDELSGFNKAKRELAPLESMAALRALSPPPSDSQIALIYGLKDRYGNLLPGLVQKEIDKPGSVLKTPGAVDGRDWVDPRLAKMKDGNVIAERNAAMSEKRKAAAKSSKPCKESPRDLWELGLAPGATPITVRQAARMLQKPEAEVAKLFADFEVEREASITGGDVIDATTQAIREKAAAGMKSKEIAVALDLDAKTVGAALKGWKPDKAA